MPEIPVLDSRTKKITAAVGGFMLAMFLLGILTGYLSVRTDGSGRCTLYKAAKDYCFNGPYRLQKKYHSFYDRVVRKFSEEVCVRKDDNCHVHGLPRNYIAYHLNGKTITVDGKDLEQAWTEVPWSKTFVDMRGSTYPKPRLATKFKMRWDDNKLYVFGYVQETDLWGTITSNDTGLWRDNQFEMLLDVDGSMRNYKQVQVNPLGTFIDLMFVQSPYDIGGWNKGGWTKNWTAGLEHATYKEGTLNDPRDKDKYWSVEFSVTFSALAENSSRPNPLPTDNEAWFVQFGRSQWKLNVTADNTYVKTETNGKQTAEWWSWQACGAVNLHLQDRWGLVQFKRNIADKKFRFDEWHIYRSLFDVLNGMKKYFAINGKYTDDILVLEVPVYILSRVCVEIPTIKVLKRNGTSAFEVTVKSRIMKHPPAHISSDKYVWFE